MGFKKLLTKKMSWLCLVVFTVTYLAPLALSCKDLSIGANTWHWLNFWTVFSIVQIVECLLVFPKFIPGYCMAKCLFVLWLWSPNYWGASLIVAKYVQPFFAKVDPL